MRLWASAGVLAAALGLAVSASGSGGVRSGTQTNTSKPGNGAAPSAAIASVTASYNPGDGSFSVAVTFKAPVSASDSANLSITYNSDSSGACSDTSDKTGVVTSTDPSDTQALFAPPSGVDGDATKSVSNGGKTITLSGADASMKNLNYQCVTANTMNTQTAAFLSSLFPPLYFTGFGPKSGGGSGGGGGKHHRKATLTTGPATNVTSSSAVMHGTINPHGFPTTVSFIYGNTPAATGTTTGLRTVRGNRPVHLSAKTAFPILHSTRIFYRLIASRKACCSTQSSRVRSFVTLP